MKRHNDIAPDHNIPPKIACHEPILNIIEPTENDQFLSDIEQQELTGMLNTQAGLGLSQMPSTPTPHLHHHLPTTTTLDNKNLKVSSTVKSLGKVMSN